MDLRIFYPTILSIISVAVITIISNTVRYVPFNTFVLTEGSDCCCYKTGFYTQPFWDTKERLYIHQKGNILPIPLVFGKYHLYKNCKIKYDVYSRKEVAKSFNGNIVDFKLKMGGIITEYLSTKMDKLDPPYGQGTKAFDGITFNVNSIKCMGWP